jgi:CHAD domain-containing protein
MPRGSPILSPYRSQQPSASRYRRAEQLHALVRKYGAELRRWLKRTLAHLQKSIPGHSKNGARIRNTAADAMVFVLKLFDELAAPVTLNRKNLHGYRLTIKELRYVLEMADGPRNQEFIDRLGKIKDAIGEWHDWEELIAITVEVVRSTPSFHAHCVHELLYGLSTTREIIVRFC